MRVALLDLDRTTTPNLALMRLASYHKNQGHKVAFWDGAKVDKLYASTVFSWNRDEAEWLRLKAPYAEIGGSGWDIAGRLPPEIEALRPDYSLYGIDYGLGFSSRGCPRKCPFCVVPAKEGGVHPVATLADLRNPLSRFIVLLDNNFLASPTYRERLEEAREDNLEVCFTQGLDIRLIDHTAASLLTRVKYYNLHRTKRKLYFAWDHPSEENAVRKGVQTLDAAGIPSHHLACYILVGFGTSFEEDMYRVQELWAMGVEPFVMQYRAQDGSRSSDPRLPRFARWVNRHFFKVSTWEKYRDNPDRKSCEQQIQMTLSITPP